MDEDVCPICETSVTCSEDSSRLTEKGLVSLQNANKARQDDHLNFLIGQKVHKKCRIVYVHKREIRKYVESKLENFSPASSSNPSRRSSEPYFDFKSHCFLCGLVFSIPNTSNISEVKSIGMKDTILDHCKKRSDSWSDSVQMRVLDINDLPAKSAKYHRSCHTKFYNNKSCPTDAKKLKVGKKIDDSADSAFLKVVEYLESNKSEQKSVTELLNIMSGHLQEDESKVYSYKYMKNKLEEHFKDRIVISN